MAKSSRDSVRSFSQTDEEFFRDGARTEPAEPIETFADLDEGYRPLTLWQRLIGKRPASP